MSLACSMTNTHCLLGAKLKTVKWLQMDEANENNNNTQRKTKQINENYLSNKYPYCAYEYTIHVCWLCVYERVVLHVMIEVFTCATHTRARKLLLERNVSWYLHSSPALDEILLELNNIHERCRWIYQILATVREKERGREGGVGREYILSVAFHRSFTMCIVLLSTSKLLRYQGHRSILFNAILFSHKL